MTGKEKNARQREYRRNNKNRCTAKYEKTRSGFLMRAYRNMQSRVTGVQSAKYHLYKGKELLSREDFYEWAKNDWHFYELWIEYDRSGYQIRLCPSVNRVDSGYGYTVNNMEWVTHSENSCQGAISKKGMRYRVT